jgi:hypothetical protein
LFFNSSIFGASGDLTFFNLLSRSLIIVFTRSSHFPLYRKFHSIFQNALSASTFDFSKFCTASSTAFSHTFVIPRLVANCPGVSQVASTNFCSSSALNLFALVDIFSPLGVMASFVFQAICQPFSNATLPAFSIGFTIGDITASFAS